MIPRRVNVGIIYFTWSLLKAGQEVNLGTQVSRPHRTTHFNHTQMDTENKVA